MKQLNNYRHFDYERFLNGKVLCYTKGTWQEKNKACSITLMILHDKDEINVGETYTVKVETGKELLTKFKPLEQVEIYDITKVSVYGEYQNQLSFHAKIKHAKNSN